MNREQAVLMRQQLWNSVALLASPLDAQIAWLRRLGTYPLADELALEFEDSLTMLDQLVAVNLVTDAGGAATRRVGTALNTLQDGSSDWSIEVLGSSQDWADVRRAAGLALVELLEPQPVSA